MKTQLYAIFSRNRNARVCKNIQVVISRFKSALFATAKNRKAGKAIFLWYDVSMKEKKSKGLYILLSLHFLFLFNAMLFYQRDASPILAMLLPFTVFSGLHHARPEEHMWELGKKFFLAFTLMIEAVYACKYCTDMELITLMLWVLLCLLPEQLESISFQFFRAMWLCMVFFGNVLLWCCLP